MNEIIKTFPQLFPIFFLFMWIFVSFTLSLLGGWRRLAAEYSTKEKFKGTKWGFQTIKVGLVNYGNCVSIGANTENLRLSVFPIFRIGHPPLNIPLNELRGTEFKGFLFRYVDLTTTKTNANIRITKKQADRINQASINNWQYENRS
jgi:hypothetical protein